MEHAMEDIMGPSIARIAAGEPLASFCTWFVSQMQPVLEADRQAAGVTDEHSRRLLLAMARRIWADVPLPGKQWRSQGLPVPERDGPCHCGSGRSFAQCCAEFADMPSLLAPESAVGMVVAALPPGQLSVEQLRQLSGDDLADVALMLRDDGAPERVVELLEPLFLEPDGLDARHGPALDILFSAMLELGLEARRERLLLALSQCADADLASVARGRHIGMLIDRAEHAQAWDLLREAQRLFPDDPQFAHLELMLLLSERRDQEARARAPLLAARVRQLGFDELAQNLLDLGNKGMAALLDMGSDDELDDEERCWLELLRAVPRQLDAARCHGLYTLEKLPPLDGQTEPVLQIQPGKLMQQMATRWRKTFPVATPMLVDLDADADAILDAPRGVLGFLRKRPDAWYSLQVLDDLLIAAREMVDLSPARSLLTAARALSAYALDVCRAVLGDARGQVVWAMLESRPFLRVIAQAITFARDCGDEAAADAWMRWSLQLNPNDNHGWRSAVVEFALERGDPGDALAWLDRYPDDVAPAAHQRALAQFMAGDATGAEATLRAAHAETPAMVGALLPDALDAPARGDGPGIAIGSPAHAWDYRATMRPTWVRSGALAWLRGLALPQPPAPSPATPAEPVQAPASVAAGGADGARAAAFAQAPLTQVPLMAAQEQRLRSRFPDLARLHGYLTAIAWSPGLVTPGIWLSPLLQATQTAPQGEAKAKEPTLESLNALLGDMMQLHNNLAGMVLTHDPQALPDILPADDAAHAWAAGFVQAAELCAAHWRTAGVAVSSDRMPFEALYALAGQAAAQAGGWRATDVGGQPVLVGVAAETPSARDVLARALTPLWRIVAPLRRQRVGA